MQKAPKLQPIRFGDFLLEKKAIDEGQLLDALAHHWQYRCRLGEALVATGHLPTEQVEELAQQYHSLKTVFV